MKKLIIRSGNLTIGGQEKMLVEFLNVLDPKKYEVLLLIEEDNGEENIYEKELPAWIHYEFLVPRKFMKKIQKAKRSKSFIRKIYYSYFLKKKKKISIQNFAKHLNFSDYIIDYDLGLLRNVEQVDLEGKTLVGWSQIGRASCRERV